MSQEDGQDHQRPLLPPPVYRPEGGLQFTATGLSVRRLTDVYHFFIRAPWRLLLLGMWLGYLLVNALFAGLYLLGGDCISGAQAGEPLDMFWFSVQTLSTIGYGAMSPRTDYAHAVATVESFVGLVSVAMGTGLIFAKFSRPSARVAFSRRMVVHQHDGRPCLMFRMANERSNQIVEARLHVSVLMDAVTREGTRMRRFRPLHLERSSTPVFAMSWVAFHPLDEQSPLYGLSPEDVARRVASVVVTFTGIDDTFAQNVHARHAYMAQDIDFNHRFVDIIDRDARGLMVLHHENLHTTQALDPDDPAWVSFPAPGVRSSGS